MRKYLCTLICLSLTTMTLYASPLSGKVISENESPISMATVVLLELDEIMVTENDGTFYFFEVPQEDYTLLAIAPGFIEQEITISLTPPFLRFPWIF